MKSHRLLVTFFFISLILHIFLFYFTKPTFFLFSNVQNIKIKKNELTKVKLIEIKPKKKKKSVKQKVKVKKLKPKIKTKLKTKTPRKTKQKIIHKKKKRSKIKRKKRIKSKTKFSKVNHKQKKKKKKINYALIEKKIQELKRKEEEKRKREELKKEAVIFYANRLVSLVQKLWIFPKTIPDSELPFLEIKVKLRVRKDGTIIGEPVVISKSPNKIFNESALRAVKKLYKYKLPLPSIVNDEYVDIILTLKPPGY